MHGFVAGRSSRFFFQVKDTPMPHVESTKRENDNRAIAWGANVTHTRTTADHGIVIGGLEPQPDRKP